MDKESKLSPAVQPFVPKTQRAFEPHQPGTPSSNPLNKQNPHQSEQSSRRSVSGASSRQRPSTTEGLRGDAENQHDYGNSRRSRGTTEPNTLRERSLCDQQMKDKNTNRRSLETQRKGFGGTRSAPISAERLKTAQPDKITFQVKMADFPELGIVAPGSPTLPSHEKPGGWRSVPQSSMPQPQSPAPMAKAALRKGQRPDSNRGVAFSETGPASSTVAPGRLSEAGSHISSSAPSVTSWANIASQPPKKLVLKERTSTSTISQREGTPVQQEEEASEKKKKRKKKKKSKAAGEQEVEESEDVLVHQEPPKLEDEEEFPDLAFAFASTPKVQNSTVMAKTNNEEIQKEQTGLQSSDQNKDKASAGKPLPSESKKGQTGGKKSKVPVQLDIGNMLAVLEKKQQTNKSMQDAKPVILSVGGALPVGHKNPPVQKKLPWQQDKVAHNPLDSTSPLIKKGKQREVPKAKKPTPLKKIILKEREERKQNRLLEERGLVPSSESSPVMATEEPCETADTTQEQLEDSADDESSPPGLAEDEEEDEVTKEAEEEREETSEKKEAESDDQTAPTLPCPPRRPKIHSRKFRDYCSQVLSKDVDECVTNLLKELVRFQDRLYQKDPMKARMKRRLVMGLREVLKHLKLRKIKCVIISPNCERSQYKGGLDEALHNIIDTCREQAVPFVFALSRKALGRCVNKAVPVSLVGVFNYDGAQDHYHKMIELSSEARRAYEVMIENLEMTSQAEQEDLEAHPSTEPQPPPCSEELEEPEYIKLWKKMLKNECNHKLLNFEEKYRSSSAASDSKAQMTEEEAS
ncbi:selenocysteine insertion sequence-binding protein 2-like isoform X1 [Osmerus mordax]|uniref:selenocysteine insertion sequence-binding protein 2-like isoform X1 n=1 Tax=Osmerus mordax TaxID=8014 RepID=UPI0035103C99